MEAWPFLVSRNPYLDYRTIVAPDFICQAGIPNLLARVAEGNLTEQGSAICRTVYGSKANDFTIIFRVVQATKKEICLPDGDEVLKDQFGREIHLIEGIVLKTVGEVSIPQKVLDQAYLLLTESYRQFWNSIEPPSVIPSSSFAWGVKRTDTLLKPKRLEAYEVTNNISRKRMNFGIELILSILNLIPSSIRPILLSVASAFLLGLLAGILLFQSQKPTIENATITINFSQDIVTQLEKLKEKYHDSAIFLSGSLTQDLQNLPRLTAPNSCVSIDKSALNMDVFPIDSAIKLFQNQKFTSGYIKIIIVQPRPKLNGTECLPILGHLEKSKKFM
jgi:hypothetical protein